MVARFNDIEELKHNCSPDFVNKNAGQLGISPVHCDDEAYECVQRGGEKQNKYHVSAKTDRTYNSIVYASKKEASKAAELDLLIKAGEIDFYLRQVKFIVGMDPKTEYIADFVTFAHSFDDYKRLVWFVEVIETKGVYAPGAKRKLKLFKQKYPDLELEVC